MDKREVIFNGLVRGIQINLSKVIRVQSLQSLLELNYLLRTIL